MIRWQRIPSISPWTLITTRILAVLAALLVGAMVFALRGLNPLELYGSVLDASFGSDFALEDFGLLLSPLLLTGLATAITLRIGLWNIGAEGQFYAGAITATAAGLALQGTGPGMLLVLLVAGFLGGMLWILLPALARAYLAVDEIITTLLLNFVAVLLVNYLTTGPWRDPRQAVTSATARIPYEVPELHGDLHWGLGIALAFVVVMAAVLAFSKWGYEIRVVGANRHAAHYAGMPVRARLMALILNAGIILQSSGVSSYEVLALTGLLLFFVAIAEQLAYYRPARLVAGR